MSASARLSVRLQDIAQSLTEVLDEVAGEPIACHRGDNCAIKTIVFHSGMSLSNGVGDAV